MAVKVGTFDSFDQLDESLKRGGGSFLRRVGDNDLLVRFLTEPKDWVEYIEHYDEAAKRFFPCSDNCVGCEEGWNQSRRYIANVLLPEESSVVPLMLPKTLAVAVSKKFKRYKTLLDRDYTLARSGTGFDTNYEVNPESERKVNLSRYELLDLSDVLENALTDYMNGGLSNGTVGKKSSKKAATIADDDDDEDEKPRTRRGGSGPRVGRSGPGNRRPGVKGRTKPSGKLAQDDDEDEEEEARPARRATVRPKGGRPVVKRGTGTKVRRSKPVQEEDEDTEVDFGDGENQVKTMKEVASSKVYTEAMLSGKGVRELRAILRDKFGYKPDDYRGMDIETLVEEILGLQDDQEAEDTAVEEVDDDAVETDVDDDEEDDEEEDDEEAEDEDEEVLDEEALNEMSMAELRALGREMGLKFGPRTKQDTLIGMILDAAEGAEEE